MAGAIGVARKGEDLGVADESVNHGGDDVVGEGLAPSGRGGFGGDEDRGLFIAQADGEVGLADAGRAVQHHVLGPVPIHG